MAVLQAALPPGAVDEAKFHEASVKAEAASGGSFVIYLEQLATMVIQFIPNPAFQSAATAILTALESLYAVFHPTPA
jgi:hypothetical protein